MRKPGLRILLLGRAQLYVECNHAEPPQVTWMLFVNAYPSHIYIYLSRDQAREMLSGASLFIRLEKDLGYRLWPSAARQLQMAAQALEAGR